MKATLLLLLVIASASADFGSVSMSILMYNQNETTPPPVASVTVINNGTNPVKVTFNWITWNANNESNMSNRLAKHLRKNMTATIAVPAQGLLDVTYYVVKPDGEKTEPEVHLLHHHHLTAGRLCYNLWGHYTSPQHDKVNCTTLYTPSYQSESIRINTPSSSSSKSNISTASTSSLFTRLSLQVFIPVLSMAVFCALILVKSTLGSSDGGATWVMEKEKHPPNVQVWCKLKDGEP